MKARFDSAQRDRSLLISYVKTDNCNQKNRRRGRTRRSRAVRRVGSALQYRLIVPNDDVTATDADDD